MIGLFATGAWILLLFYFAAGLVAATVVSTALIIALARRVVGPSWRLVGAVGVAFVHPIGVLRKIVKETPLWA